MKCRKIPQANTLTVAVYANEGLILNNATVTVHMHSLHA